MEKMVTQQTHLGGSFITTQRSLQHWVDLPSSHVWKAVESFGLLHGRCWPRAPPISFKRAKTTFVDLCVCLGMNRLILCITNIQRKSIPNALGNSRSSGITITIKIFSSFSCIMRLDLCITWSEMVKT